MVGARPEHTRLARLLFERRMTHEELAVLSGVSRATISKAVNGRDVSTDTWIRFAEALGVSVTEVAPPAEAARIVAVA